MSVTNQASTKTYEREAEATRNRLSISLDELAASLTPGTMLDEVLTYARAGGADFLRGLGKSASANPIPTMLIGLGAAMFLTGKGRIDGSDNGHGAGVLRHAANMMRGTVPRDRASDYGAMAAGEAYRAEPAYGPGSAGPGTRGAGRGATSAASRVGDAAAAVGRGAQAAASGAGTAASRTAQAAGSAASGAASAVRSAASATTEAVGSAASSAVDAVAATASGAADQMRSGASAVGDATRHAADAAREAAVAGFAAAGDLAASAGGMVADAAGTVADSARAAASSANELAGAAGTTAAERGQRLFDQTARLSRDLSERTARLIQEQPLAVAAAGLAIGAALAAALPRTRMEDSLLGETSDAVKDSVAGAATEEFHRAKEATGRVIEEAKDVAAKEGLSASAAAEAVRDIGEKVKHVVAAAGSEATKAG